MLVLGLLLLAGAVIVGVAGVAANTGSEHQLAGGFGIFGYHLHSSSGKLLLAGLVIGAVAMLGFIMATEGLRRNAALRRELFRFRRQARTRERTATTAPQPQPREPVLARTAPTTSSGDTDVTSTGARTSAGTGGTAADGVAPSDSAAADGSAADSAGRRSLRNWRTPRPTS